MNNQTIMKTYKSLQDLEEEANKNDGQQVYVWDDEGIKVNGKRFYVFEYGNMEINFKGNCYITFRNEGHKGKTNRNNPIGVKDSFITIEYELLPNAEKPMSHTIFKFVKIRENW